MDEEAGGGSSGGGGCVDEEAPELPGSSLRGTPPGPCSGNTCGVCLRMRGGFGGGGGVVTS